MICLDYSLSAVSAMKRLAGEDLEQSDGMEVQFIQADATMIPFRKRSFDLVLDKGTTDSVLKFADRRKAFTMAKMIQNEALRILSPSGVYIQITDEDPDMRIPLLKELKERDFSVSYREISSEDSWEYFMYVLKLNKPVV